MDAAKVNMLRQLLDGTEWVQRTQSFARSLRRSTRTPGSLLLVGTPEQEPWHFAAHLQDEAQYADVPELTPTLVRWSPPPGAPAHLSVGLERIAAARRGESLLVVAPDAAPDSLLERVDDARRIGATIFALDGGDDRLVGLAHDALSVPTQGLFVPSTTTELVPPIDVVNELDGSDMSFDTVEHLVSLAAGEAAHESSSSRTSVRDRIAQLIERVSGPASRDY